MPRSPEQPPAGVRCADGLAGRNDSAGQLRDPAVLAYSWRGALVRRFPPRGRRRATYRRGRGGGPATREQGFQGAAPRAHAPGAAAEATIAMEVALRGGPGNSSAHAGVE
eukprot:9479181-Alexandrium_andersonii.AAC.1